MTTTENNLSIMEKLDQLLDQAVHTAGMVTMDVSSAEGRALAAEHSVSVTRHVRAMQATITAVQDWHDEAMRFHMTEARLDALGKILSCTKEYSK